MDHLYCFLLVFASILTKTQALPDGVDRYNRLFESCHEEVPPMTATELDGAVPSWLNGIFLRNGPGIFEMGERVLEGWSDGYGKIEQWMIANGQVHFGTQFIRSDFYNRSVEEDDVAYTFGILGSVKPTFPRVPMREKMRHMTDNYNVNVWSFSTQHTHVSALSDFHSSDLQIDLSTLQTNSFDFDEIPMRIPELRVSHPQLAVGNPNITYSIAHSVIMTVPFLGYRLCVQKLFINKNNRLERQNVACDWIQRASSFHSMAISENFVLLFDSPLIADASPSGESLQMKWMKGDVTRVLILDLRNPDRGFMTKEIPTHGYCGHAVNMWEVPADDGSDEINLVTDWECADGEGFISMMFDCQPHRLCPHKSETTAIAPGLWRFRFSLKRQEVEISQLRWWERISQWWNKNSNENNNMASEFSITDGGLEDQYKMVLKDDPIGDFYGIFMTANNEMRGRPYCYSYSVGIDESEQEWFVAKSDVCSATIDTTGSSSSAVPTQRWSIPGHIPNEPKFVAHPNAAAEDDGVVICTVHDTFVNKTYLAILDGQTLELLSTSYAPIQSFYGIHGRFLDFSNGLSY